MRSFTIIILCMSFFLTSFAFAQVNEQIDGKTYKDVKVKLTSGEVLKGSNLILSDSELKFTPKSSRMLKILALSDVKDVMAATKSYWVHGILPGGALTYIAVTLLDRKNDDGVVNYTASYSEDTGYQYNEEEEGLSTDIKIAIVAGGIIVGALIGNSIKGGWQKIYSTKETSEGISLEAFPSSDSYVPLLTMRFRF